MGLDFALREKSNFYHSYRTETSDDSLTNQLVIGVIVDWSMQLNLKN